MYINRHFYLLPFLILFLFISCNDSDIGPKPLPDNYEQLHQEWLDYRISVLTDTTGWLRLQNLIWFDEGPNSFGSGENQDIQFPEGSIAENAGTFILDDGSVTMVVNNGINVRHEGESVDTLKMVGDDIEERIHATHGPLTWFIDKRGDQRGVKVFSMDTPKADRFDGFPMYPIQQEWYHNALFVPHEEETNIEIVNVLGEVVDRYSPGRVEFQINGERYSLDAFESSSGLFLMFSDATSKTETYQAGRYMIVPPPGDDGFLILDFNKAYNPPCAYNPFTTCQLPPSQNRLDVAIPAGEKRPVEWEGI
ncbi:DUF1684 domain-containing protein [Rhodohalobacter sp. 8-1]|uniref:DUF1684 domain-containing protein n=1 Tax=Rhodohalobacter sp. 8-1 TaxID=3131972 RepID=UPI0030ECC0AD